MIRWEDVFNKKKNLLIPLIKSREDVFNNDVSIEKTMSSSRGVVYIKTEENLHAIFYVH